jgi:hypothetical protein
MSEQRLSGSFFDSFKHLMGLNESDEEVLPFVDILRIASSFILLPTELIRPLAGNFIGIRDHLDFISL